MITSMILGYFINGVYQLVVLYSMGKIIPVSDRTLLLSSGRGIKNTVDLTEISKAVDNAIPLKIFGYDIPVLTLLFIVGLCFFIIWFRKTKLGQDMRAVGQDMEVSKSAGIEVNKVRIYSIVISTVLAGIGQVIYLQNLGTINTYNSHEQIGMFSVAALLIGGASVARATIPNAIGGVILFHTMFVVAPRAGKELMGSSQIGEYFRVFISYGIIVLILVVISVILFVTGKRHDILIENNSMAGIKYSINGEPYKTLDAGKKALGISKGVGNVIFIKTADNKVIEKELPSKNINLFINQAINNGEDWYKESEK